MATERSRLVDRFHRHLERHGWPRVQLFLIVSLAGVAGFMVSYAMLSAGVDSMAVRYALATTAGYIAFLAVLAGWLAWKRRGDIDVDFADLIDVPMPRGGRGIDAFAGGRSGGGGSTAAWGEPLERTSSTASGGSGADSWFDVDDLGWVVLAAVALLSGAIAIAYVVWIAPALLAEVLVDAAIVSALSRRVSHLERRDWTATVVRRTWIPAVILIVAVATGGFALQQLAPEARSIGPAIEAVLARLNS